MSFTIRPARMEDAGAIAFVHVESWKSTYAGIVPDEYLASLSVKSRTVAWKELFDAGTSLMFVAEDTTGVFGFVSGGKLRDRSRSGLRRPFESPSTSPQASIRGDRRSQ